MTFEWEVEAEAMNHFQNFGSCTVKNLSALERMWVWASECSQVQKTGSWLMFKTWHLQHMGFDWARHETKNNNNKTEKLGRSAQLLSYLPAREIHGISSFQLLQLTTRPHRAWAIGEAKVFTSQDTGIPGIRLPKPPPQRFPTDVH